MSFLMTFLQAEWAQRVGWTLLHSLVTRARRLLGQSPRSEFGYRSISAWLAVLLTFGTVGVAVAVCQTSGDPPTEAANDESLSLNERVVRAFRIKETAHSLDPGGPVQFPVGFDDADEADPWEPQISGWSTTTPDQEFALHMPFWELADRTPVDLCFSVIFRVIDDGTTWECDPVIVARGEKASGYFSLRNSHQFCTRYEGFVPVTITLKPLEPTAAEHAHLTDVWQETLVSETMRARSFRFLASKAPPVVTTVRAMVAELAGLDIDASTSTEIHAALIEKGIEKQTAYHICSMASLNPYNRRLGAAVTRSDTKEVIPLLVKLLADQDSLPINPPANAAARCLEGIGQAAVPELIEALDGDNREVRVQIAYLLNNMATNERRAALKPLVLPHLLPLLRDDDPALREAVAHALHRFPDSTAVEPLIASLSDDSPKVRANAAMALGWNRDARAAEPLFKALKDENDYVRQNAASALGRIPSAETLPPLLAALKGDRFAYVRREAAWSLAYHKDPSATAALTSALNDVDPSVIVAAAYGLGELKAETAIKPLIEAMQRGPNARRASARALKKITGEDLGEEASAWSDWARKRSAPEADPPKARPPERLVSDPVQIEVVAEDKKPVEVPQDRLVVDLLRTEGNRRDTPSIWIGNEQLEGGAVRERLTRLLRLSPQREALVRASRDLPVEELNNVVILLDSLGAKRVSIAVFPLDSVFAIDPGPGRDGVIRGKVIASHVGDEEGPVKYTVTLDHEAWTNHLGELPNMEVSAGTTFEFRNVPAGKCRVRARLIPADRVARRNSNSVEVETTVKSKDVVEVELRFAESPDGVAWGEAVGGVSARLRSPKAAWTAGQEIRLLADIRNRGNAHWSVAQAQQLCRMEWDGETYHWQGESGVKSSALPPERQYKDIPIVPSAESWHPVDRAGDRISLTPGKHTVRVVFLPNRVGNDVGFSRKVIKVASNLIQIEISQPPEIQVARPMDGDARQQFLKIESIARLSDAEQLKQLPQLYTQLAPRYMSPLVEGLISSYRAHILNRANFDGPGGNHTERWADQLADAEEELSPDEVADKLEIGLWLNVASRARAIQILKRHKSATKKLIDADLKSGREQEVNRACATILSLQWRAYTDQLLAMYMAVDNGPEGIYRTLLFMHDPSITPLLLRQVEADPEFLKRCAGLLQGPLWRKPAAPTLLQLLESPDVELRYAAVRAVYECSDPKLAQPLVNMARDKEARFRVAAAYLAANLPADSFAGVRDQLVQLLSDVDEKVKFGALRSFAQQGDLAAGEVILETIKGNAPPEGHKVTVMQAMSALADSTFNYSMHRWGPETAANKKAIAKFEDWLKRKTRQSSDEGAGH